MKKRVISAIVALSIVVPLIILGGIPYYIGCGILGIVGFYEIMNLREQEKQIPLFIKIIIFISFILLMMSGVRESYGFDVDYRMLTIVTFMCMLPILVFSDRKRYNCDDALYMLGATFFLGTAFNFLITIRNINVMYLVYILLITIMTDTFAHFFGTKIGRIKLCPTVSPNKTVEGMLGGTFFGTFTGSVFFSTFISSNIPLLYIVLTSLFLSIMAQFGDLVFSAIKRSYGVKDFGNIMPGHGGVLDRLDSILFAIYAFTFVITLFY